MDISVLVVNLNNLEFTKDCVSDLMSQDCNFNLTIIDQNSSEEGTKEYFSTLPENIEFIQNDYNVNLNQLWNWFVLKSNTPYICLLNNDVRIAPNFLSSAIQVLEKEPNVGFVNHISNNKDYQEWSFELNYKIIETPCLITRMTAKLLRNTCFFSPVHNSYNPRINISSPDIVARLSNTHTLEKFNRT